MNVRNLQTGDLLQAESTDLTHFVAAIIITYNCYTSIERTILAVASQVGRVIIVDNGSDPETLDAIREAIDHSRLQDCEFLPQGRNLGIGAALNIGVRAALAAGAEYVLPLDDDTEFFPGAVADLVRCCIAHGDRHVVAARWITSGTVPETSYGVKDEPRSVERIPSTGCLISRHAFESVGMFREDYFLDYTDYEFCARIVAAGWRVLTCPTATVFHRPGDIVLRPFFGRTLVVSNYPAERLYLLCRNGFVLYLWEWRSGSLLRQHIRVVIVTFVKSTLYEREKLRKVSAIIRGSVAGLLGNLGPPARKDGDHQIRRRDRV